MDAIKLDGLTAIVTGSNSGIGKEVAKQLGRRGCRVIMACRSKHLAMEARESILNDLQVKPDNLVVMHLDLGSFKSIREFVDDFCSNEYRLNYLINNAGVFGGNQGRTTTAEGFETHFGINHLGHFLLTVLLLDKMKASSPSRIVNVSSEAYKYGKLDFSDLEYEHNWKCFSAYARSKTANLLFTVALGNRLTDTGVTVYAVHPGMVKTNLLRNFNKAWLCCIGCIIKTCCVFRLGTAAKGAKPILHCCLEPSLENETGLYYYSDCTVRTPKLFACDPEMAEKLWKLSLELVGLVGKSVKRK